MAWENERSIWLRGSMEVPVGRQYNNPERCDMNVFHPYRIYLMDHYMMESPLIVRYRGE